MCVYIERVKKVEKVEDEEGEEDRKAGLRLMTVFGGGFIYTPNNLDGLAAYT